MKNSKSFLIILVIFSLVITSAFTLAPEDTKVSKLEQPPKKLETKSDTVDGALNPKVVPVNPILLERYEAFFPAKVLKVTDGVYVAKGYNRDNPTLIVGEDGLIIVDPGESIVAAQAVKDAFNAELDNIFDKKPVKAIIYTHSHDCHIQGAAIFADSETEIIAHEDLMTSLYDEWYGQVYPSRITGGAMMSGIMYESSPAKNNEGWFAGYVLAGANVQGPSGFIPPTISVKDKLETRIAGVELNLIAAPGETRDIIVVWLPEKKVLIEIGLVYEAFPALTTMRGSRQRDAMDYVNSIRMLRSLKPEHMVALHGPNPITRGSDKIQEYLTNFSDAIQFMNDQTIYYLNRGYTAGEMMDLIELPPHLASNSYLQETYGSKDWNIVHLSRYYRGYYTGQTRDLFPQSTESEAEMSVMLAGGIKELIAKAKDAVKEENLEWALRLSDDVLVVEPDNAEAFEIKKSTMLALAEKTMNSQARNMLLSEYMLITGQSKLPFEVNDAHKIYSNMSENIVELMPIETLNKIMTVNLNASKSMETDLLVKLKLKDVEEEGQREYILNVRKGILEIDPPNAGKAKFTVTTDIMTWKRLVLSKMTPQDAIENKLVTVSSGKEENFYTFMDLFKEVK